jgi:hypothetical protein
MINYDEILNKIIDANTKTDISNSKDYIKIDIIGNTITGRLLPNIKDVAHSTTEYFHHGWKSKIDGGGIFQLCPNTYGQKCPTCNKSITMWRGTDPIQKELSKQIRRRQNWLVNFYVINDVKNPKNNGTVKILKYGMQIKKKYDMATTGVDKEIYGSKIWRLDDKGVNFRIICEQNSEAKEAWPTYTNSGFIPSAPIEGMTDEKINQILNNVFDLTKGFQRKTYDELLAELNKHFFSNDITIINEKPSETPTQQSLTPVEDDLNMNLASAPEPAEKVNNIVESVSSDNEIDAMIRELQAK